MCPGPEVPRRPGSVGDGRSGRLLDAAGDGRDPTCHEGSRPDAHDGQEQDRDVAALRTGRQAPHRGDGSTEEEHIDDDGRPEQDE